ncbi:MAG: hypothetical protein OEZ34_09980 [Spirochaetia bacterium]|nr:hypothetical protein [Spirochaetia bacterium]
MMNTMKIAAVIGLIFVLLSGCNPNQEMLNYQETEILRIQKSIEYLLSELGYSGYEILISAHGSMGQKLISRNESSEILESEFIDDESVKKPPGFPDLDNRINDYRMHDSVRNFDEFSDPEFYYFHYVSVLVLMKHIDRGKADKLESIIRQTILDNRRADKIFIIQKSDFSNLEKKK